MEFCKGWSYWKEGSAEVKEVTLPHDAQLTERRFAEAASGNGGAFLTEDYIIMKRSSLYQKIGKKRIYGLNSKGFTAIQRFS